MITVLSSSTYDGSLYLNDDLHEVVNCGDRKRLERAMAQLKLDSGIKNEVVFVLQGRIMTVAAFAEGKVVWFQDAL